MDRIWVLLFVMAMAAAAGTADAATCQRLDAATWLLGERIAPGESEVTVESWLATSPDTFERSGETRTSADGKIVGREARKLEYTLQDDGTMTVAVSDGAGKGFTLRFRCQGDRRP